MEARTHIALVSMPAFTHQVSILEFAKRLIHLHQDHFHVTCIIPTFGSPTTSSKPFFDSLPPSIHSIFLPPPNFEELSDHALSIEAQLQLSVSRSMSAVREVLRSISLTSRLVALIADAFAHEAIDIGKELNILSYIYFPCSAMLLSLCLYSSKLDETVTCEYKDHPEPIEIPGCISIYGIDLPDSVMARSSVAYKFYLNRCERYRLADGILVNSFMELEAEAIRAALEVCGGPIVHPVGPIIQTGSSGYKNGSECLMWLEKQPPNSVLYISFGSGGTLSQEQINELALGLERSSHKFLWVNVRAPNNRASASYLNGNSMDPLNFLPSGFLERTKGQGLVMPSWAPQIEVLSHNSVGAFLCHCGWNSILESIVQGVPMIAWPLFAEQRTNAAMVTEGLKVAVRPKIGGNGIIVKEEIACHIKSLMEGLEGEEIRRRMKELKNSAACATMDDGSSTKTISKLAMKWKSLGDP